MSSIRPRNIIGRLTNIQEPVYTVATTHATVSAGYSRKQFY